MLNQTFERFKSYSLAPAGFIYKSVFKGNRSLRLHPENYETKSIFVHIPKAGGFSVAMALYGRDPWHFRAIDYRNHCLKNNIEFSDFFIFSAVRDPVNRLNSMYNYLKGQSYTHRAMVPLKLASNLVEFVEIYLEKSETMRITGKGHPFFFSQLDYLRDQNKEMLVDGFARLESLKVDFAEIAAKIDRPDAVLLHKNKSKVSLKVTTDQRALIAPMLKEEMDILGYKA